MFQRRVVLPVRVLEGLAVALANIDPIIALIKALPSPAEAKRRLLMEYVWAPGVVVEMLERAGAESLRPRDLPEQYERRGLSPLRSPGPCDPGFETAAAHGPGTG